MKAAECFPFVLAAFFTLALVMTAEGAAINDTIGSCAGSSCSTDTAVGIVNVTLVEGPSPVTGMFLTPFDFQGVFSAVSSFFSSIASSIGF
jgi:hypothetical protein